MINIEPEDDDDDLIYECPGLAPHGEMEVTNPFFLGNTGVPGVEKTEGGDRHSLINTNNVIRNDLENLVKNYQKKLSHLL